MTQQEDSHVHQAAPLAGVPDGGLTSNALAGNDAVSTEVDALTPQTIFDKTLRHIRRQGVASVAEGAGATPSCRYRTADGRMCAAGCLIADEHYSAMFEGRPASNPAVVRALSKSGIQEGSIGLVQSLQHAHDDALLESGMESWEAQMQEIARDFGLTYSAPEAA